MAVAGGSPPLSRKSLHPNDGVREALQTGAPLEAQLRAQRRIVAILACATILGGLGVGASLSAGALLIADVTGNDALSGFGPTMNGLGAALAGIPLARLAARVGRRTALACGNLVAVLGAILVIVAAAQRISVLLFVGLAMLGVAAAVQLQSRFAAADLALPARRGRDLSLVVWSITVGAVTGPNLIGPGADLGAAVGLPELSGVFLFTIVAQLAAAAVVWFGLRPDPLLEARRIATLLAVPSASAGVHHTDTSREALTPAPTPTTAPPPSTSATPQILTIGLIALAQAVMVGLMAMTPLHLTHHGGSITLVGFTLSIHIAGMYALSPVFGYLTGRFGGIAVVGGGFALRMLAARGTYMGGSDVGTIQLALVLLGLGWSAVTVAGSTLLTELTPADRRPVRQGQSDTTMNAAGALFGAVAGVIFAGGGFPVLSIVAGVLIVLGVAATVRLSFLTRR